MRVSICFGRSACRRMTQCLPPLRACITAQEEEEEEEEDDESSEGSPVKKRGRPLKGSEKPPEEDRACPNAGCGKGFRKYTALVKHMKGCLAEMAAKEQLAKLLAAKPMDMLAAAVRGGSNAGARSHTFKFSNMTAPVN